MQFKPKTEEEIQQENLLPNGTYPFTVKKSAEAVDKNQNEFFKLKLFVHGPQERDWHVYDNVSPNWMAHKLRHLCFAVGLGNAYESGNVSAAMLEERQGSCEVGFEPALGKYPAKNIVIDYVVPEGQKEASSKAAGKQEEPEDSVPF